MPTNLMNKEARAALGAWIESEKPRLQYNADIFQILEGNLSPLLADRMLADLGERSAHAASTRKAPINVFQKVIDKLTKIYSDPVKREVETGNKSDDDILRFYEKTLNLNSRMIVNNEFYNAYRYSLLWIMLKDVNEKGVGIPFIRSVPNHQFLIKNDSREDPTSPDIIILCFGKVRRGDEDCDVYWVYSEYQFVIMDQKGELHQDMMDAYQSSAGENPYEILPFTYNNASQNLVMPMIQSDNKEIALLIPLLLTDLNYAVKYQAFSVFYTIDTDDTKIELSPNSFINFKSRANAEGETKPAFGVIKPTVDIGETLSLASSEMSLYLVSKGLRPAAIGQIGTDKFSSGISKMIDESDAYDSIKKQIAVYEKVEDDFWNVRIRHLHKYWVANNMIELTVDFSETSRIKTTFTQPAPMQTRKELIDELRAELDGGLTTVERAVKKLYPNLTEDEIKGLVVEVKAEAKERAPKPAQNQQFPSGEALN